MPTHADLTARLARAQQHLDALHARDAEAAELAGAYQAVADAHQALADHHPRNPFGPDQPAQRAAWPLATRQPTL